MKKHYTTVLQVLQILLICLLSTTASFASNSPITTSPSVESTLGPRHRVSQFLLQSLQHPLVSLYSQIILRLPVLQEQGQSQ